MQEVKINIFYVNEDPFIAAQQMVDRHVVKMVLESAQLLSTAHRIIDGVEYVGKSKTGRNAKRWRLDDPNMEDIIYGATHVNHPSAIWCRQSDKNYQWLYRHFIGLLGEYTFRYGKVHKCAEMAKALSITPKAIHVGPFTHVTPAMLEEYRIKDDSIASYRNYYRVGKAHLHAYTKRPAPAWLTA